jgi:hypothetical protein
MDSRLRFGAARTLLAFVGMVVLIGMLAGIDQGSGPLREVLRIVWWGFIVLGAAIVLIRMWHKHHPSDDPARGGLGAMIGALPPRWRRWILDETEPD